MGPRGLRYNESTDDLIKAYGMLGHGRPEAPVGSFEAVGLDDKACFDRLNRYAPYGLTTGRTLPDGSLERSDVDWSSVSWGRLQQRCRSENAGRFAPMQYQKRDADAMLHDELEFGPMISSKPLQAPPKKRTAVLIRTWDSYNYTENDLFNIRAIVTELALWSRAEYEVILFVNVKDKTLPIYTDREIHQQVLEASVPLELRDMAMLWNEDVLGTMYSKLGMSE